MKNLFQNLILLLFILYLFSSSVSTIQAVTINTFQVTTDGSQQKDPLVYKNIIAYDAQTDIWGYDINTQTNFPILQKTGQQFLTGFYEDLIVFEDFDDTTQTTDVRLFNKSSNTDILIGGGPGAQSDGVTNGKNVVYINGGACGSLQSYDLSTTVTTQIFNSTCTPLRISNDIVVFQVADPNGTNVKGFNLNTNQLIDISSENNFQEEPNLYQNNVVWLHSLEGGYGSYNAIVMKDLNTNIQKIIYESSTNSLHYPAISDKYIVWSESSAIHVNGVKGANIQTGEVFEIQPQGPHQNSHTTPSIWDNIASWMSFRTGNGDIYASVLNPSTITPTPTPTVTPIWPPKPPIAPKPPKPPKISIVIPKPPKPPIPPKLNIIIPNIPQIPSFPLR